ncbi:MAG: DNA repair protein RadC [Peptoniphilus sp.]|nr:DNA repair protein RadC [Peptoniphilus sp.]MDD7363678.1 DNA repair protein RadC [Bacillota bacterium]MDY6044063.1 DNA repair protein RadC [Peptoniphilus sp.]
MADQGKTRKALSKGDLSNLPEEKLMRLGPDSLSDSELLALFLRTGTYGLTAIELAQTVIDALGEKSPAHSGLSSLMTGTYEDFLSIKGIGKSKAARLVGMVEIARRMREPLSMSRSLNSPSVVAEYVMPQMLGLQHEEFHVIGLNVKKQLHYVECISKGTLDCTVVHPRDVFQGAISKKCHSVVLVHNHPAGNPKPSAEDRRLTERLCRAGDILGIPVVDHIIVGDHAYYSFLEDGAL